jgi:hypothetical protein
VLELGSEEATLKWIRLNLHSFDTLSQIQARKFYGVHKLNTDEKKGVEELDMYSRIRFMGFKDLHNHTDDPNYEFLSVLEERLVESPHLAFRTPQIYIRGGTGLGKTLLINTIMEHVAHYRYPENGWHKDYYSDVYQVIFYDECDFGTKDIKRLLLDFVQGGPNVKLNVKGTHTFKRDNAFMYCASNYSLLDNYCGSKYIHLDSIPHCISLGECADGVVDCCGVQLDDGTVKCKYLKYHEPFKAFSNRFDEFYIEYPLHGFMNQPESSIWLNKDDCIKRREMLEARYSNHAVINWCSLDNMIFSDEPLPQEYNKLYKQAKKEGYVGSYVQYKKEQQEGWLERLKLENIDSQESLDDVDDNIVSPLRIIKVIPKGAFPQDYHKLYKQAKKDGYVGSYKQYKKEQQEGWLARLMSVDTDS